MSERPAIDILGASGGVYIRQLAFAKAGDRHDGHLHDMNHVTLVLRGRVRCEVEGHPAIELCAGARVTIDKDTFHTFTALADDTVYFCIFSMFDETGRRVGPKTDRKVDGPAACATCPIACSP